MNTLPPSHTAGIVAPASFLCGPSGCKLAWFPRLNHNSNSHARTAPLTLAGVFLALLLGLAASGLAADAKPYVPAPADETGDDLRITPSDKW